MPWEPDVETNLAIRSANHLKVRFIQQSHEKLIYWQQQNQNNRVDYYFTILASYYQLIAFIENLQKTHPILLIHQLKITPKKNNLHCECILSSMTKSLT
ncbi:hypothetical protein E3U36_01030 [Arsenophonus endosymbiont of Aphis craccivora]|uniref:hypothetical protein n=1 Tax=Arsenophonus endosymbiont of Aphis craccivora TaxID=1231049 RepID=UPI0015DC07CE|nr:hypothetical protein [Arsenophonus endosymbiont of Aphis craccivora]QLK87121.1 hypothetical protein E3U36_01030 [Arsenophonus endosymbiont of Aphis craccivora]